MGTDGMIHWLNKLVSLYRQKAEELSPEERQYLVYDFGSPCQVHVLWSANNQSQSSYQLLIFTHFLEKSDLNFNIFGPFEPYRFSEYAAKMLTDPQWNQELPYQDHDIFWEISERTYRGLLIRILRGFLRSNESYFTQRALLSKDFPNGLIASKQGLFYENKDFLWEVWGDIRVLDQEKLVDEDLKDAQMTLERIRNQTNIGKTSDFEPCRKLPNYGAILYPAVWIGERPTQSVEDQLQGKHIQAKVILNCDSGDSRIILRQDGFIAVMLPGDIAEEKRRATALEELNGLVAALFFLDIPLEAIREHDLLEVTIDPEATRLGSMSYHPERLRRPIDSTALWGWVDPPTSYPLTPDRITISQDKLSIALQLAKEFSGDPIKRNLTSFVLEAYTLFRNAEYSQSFLSSWLVLETHIGVLWNNYVESGKVGKERTKRLQDPNRWSADYLMETLNLAGRLTKDEYDALTKLKKRRNRVTHSGLRVTENEAEQCLKWATDIVRKVCGITAAGPSNDA